MAKNDNLTDFLVDVADAIREKKGTTELINPQDFASEIASIESGGGNGWTGHADAEGLRAIGWTEEDITYYQENGVDWNEEDDHLHLVSDDNKALYGALTAYNISSYKDRIVYLPKIDTSGRVSMQSFFAACQNMVAFPMLDTSNVTNMDSMCYRCFNLRCIPPLDFRNVTTMQYAFYECVCLKYIPPIDAPQCTHFTDMCYRAKLEEIYIDMSSAIVSSGMLSNCSALKKVFLRNTINVTNWRSMFNICQSIRSIEGIDMINATDTQYTFTNLLRCEELDIKSLRTSIELSFSYIFRKQSLLNIINNEAATSPITITLATNVYNKYSTDPDVVEALANHPNITLAK